MWIDSPQSFSAHSAAAKYYRYSCQLLRLRKCPTTTESVQTVRTRPLFSCNLTLWISLSHSKCISIINSYKCKYYKPVIKINQHHINDIARKNNPTVSYACIPVSCSHISIAQIKHRACWLNSKAALKSLQPQTPVREKNSGVGERDNQKHLLSTQAP